MPVLSTLKYSISLLFLILWSLSINAQQPDSSGKAPLQVKDLHPGHQLRVYFDASKPVINALAKNRQAYDFGIDYYWRKEAYFVVEGGFGNSNINYTDLSYESRNTFFRAGIDKNMLQRLFKKDWDAAFVGLRYGLGLIRRGKATYTVTDPLFGSSSGRLSAQNYTAHWAEINGGVRVELWKNFMVGWNVRAKFLLNPKTFTNLAPAYIAGYGKGDGSTAFDFNLNLCYAFRWGGNEKDVKK